MTAADEIRRRAREAHMLRATDAQIRSLSDRQLQVLALVEDDAGPREIAQAMGIEYRSAVWSVWSLACRLGFPNASVMRKAHSNKQ